MPNAKSKSSSNPPAAASPAAGDSGLPSAASSAGESNPPPVVAPSNDEIAGLFENLGLMLEMQGDSVFKVRAYQRAARTIEQLSFSLAERVAAGQRLTGIPGIGKAIGDKIAELVQTGRVATYERVKGELPPGILELVGIPGIGPKTAMLLSRELGLSSAAGVEQAAQDGRLAALPRMGEKAAASILRHLQDARREPPPEYPPAGTPDAASANAADLDVPESAEGALLLDEAAAETLRQLRRDLAAGVAWPQALLLAVGRWPLAEEIRHGQTLRYMIGGEAFDWLLLAQRLLAETDGAVPPEEQERLLFYGRLPEAVDDDEFRRLLGPSKYRAHLNCYYGIALEETLQLETEEAVRKRHTAQGYADSEELEEEAFRQLYRQSRTGLLDEFRRETRRDRRRRLTVADLKEFTYWLHRKRLKLHDPARVASDTRKALRRHAQLQAGGAPGTP